MYPDYLQEYILAFKIPWFAIAAGYAVFDYIFNFIMCSIIGGVTNTSTFIKEKLKTLTTRRLLKEALKRYRIGSRKQIKEFQSDKLSWLWPLTSVFIPTFIYGITKELTNQGLESLTKNGVIIGNYVFLPADKWVQLSLWLIAITLGLRSFYRYQKERSKPTWFSKFWGYNLSRLILFDIPLTYMIIGIIYTWILYATSLFSVLADSQIQYTVLNSDRMYGLAEVYNTVIILGLSLIVLSLMPAFMLIRESQEKYNKMYVFLIYTGLIVLFIMLGILVLRFDERLSSIQKAALDFAQMEFYSKSTTDIQAVSSLQFFSTVAGLPGSFPVPQWFSLLISARAAVFTFEIIRIINPSIIQKSKIINLAQKILSK